ncbi:MAG: polysaccharide export protein [Gammaproteobacteria bacterium]|nr:polysaccharide export protein [Gammaproteobacteria bacterium]NNJ83737.1 polysaccharide export protein [Gammaproteobacteria bacterium]
MAFGASSVSYASGLEYTRGLENLGILGEYEQAQPIPEPLADEQVRTDWHTGLYGSLGKDEHSTITPFGAQLFFNGGFGGIRADALNPDYRLVPGDQVILRLWGAIEFDKILPVDAQGNIFIPTIGPVMVQGLTYKQLDGTVSAAVKSVYPEEVYIYVKLQGVQPIAVFVAGYVKRPGHYAGTPTESLLYFLAQADGIDDELGSYRQIKILRGNRVIAKVDLYEFLLRGKLPRPQFREGDTILVEERGSVVTVTGDVTRDYHYELTPGSTNGAELLELARIKPNVSHALLRGTRARGPVSLYLPLDAFSRKSLQNGDEVLFSADRRNETIVIQLEGSFHGASRYALPKDARLHELLDAIAVPRKLTDVKSVSLRRISIANQQKQSLMESLRRLETTYLGAPANTLEEAEIRVQEAELIRKFVGRASLIEPTGRLVVTQNDRIMDVRLEDGDVITLPEFSDAIQISGEVLMPRAVVYKAGLSVTDYIDGVGGFTQHADKNRILVMRRNGDVRQAWDVELRPGDEILVLPLVSTKNLQLASAMAEILYRIAIAAKVILDL